MAAVAIAEQVLKPILAKACGASPIPHFPPKTAGPSRITTKRSNTKSASCSKHSKSRRRIIDNKLSMGGT